MYGMLKESAKVLQSGRQIAIQAELFAARQAGWELDGSWMGAAELQSNSQTTSRPPPVLGKDARPDKTRPSSV